MYLHTWIRVTRDSKFPTNEVIPSMIRFEASCNQNLRDTRLVPWSAATNHGWCTSLLSKWVYFTNVTRVYFRYIYIDIVSIVSRVYVYRNLLNWLMIGSGIKSEPLYPNISWGSQHHDFHGESRSQDET